MNLQSFEQFLTTPLGQWFSVAVAALVGAFLRHYFPAAWKWLQTHPIPAAALRAIPRPKSLRLIPRPSFGSVAASGKPVKLFTNGIYDFDTIWEQAMVAWVNANCPTFAAAFFHYDADAILTGLWANQHAQGLHDAIAAQLAAGAPYVDLFAHSEGNDVVVRCLQQYPDLKGKVRVYYACAAALADDCASNGINALITGGMVSQVHCMCSTKDGVLGSIFQLFTPYFWGKTLGLDGSKNFAPRVSTYWKNDETHTHWTDGDDGNAAGCNTATVAYVCSNPNELATAAASCPSCKPRKRLAMICGVDCHPGDAICNNYCNEAPQKGPMACCPPPGPDWISGVPPTASGK